MKAAEELIKYNITTALCVNHEIGNISLDQREKGFRKGDHSSGKIGARNRKQQSRDESAYEGAATGGT